MVSTVDGNEEIQRRYEAEYIAWLQIAAKEIAAILKKLDTDRINSIVTFYEDYINHPASLHLPLEGGEEETVEHLIGKDRIEKIIFLKTKALIFAPSILAPFTSSLDYGTAMHRRFFLKGLWFSVIAMNEAYIKSATETMLRYMIEHEIALGEYYKKLAMRNVEVLTPVMKGAIHEEMRREAIIRSGIADEEVEQERKLIIDLSAQYPLVPVHIASASLLRYLEENWEEVKPFGLASENEIEKELELSTEKLTEWYDLSINAFKFFVAELKREITMTGAEYGSEIV
jgi:hypothetical protein